MIEEQIGSLVAFKEPNYLHFQVFVAIAAVSDDACPVLHRCFQRFREDFLQLLPAFYSHIQPFCEDACIILFSPKISRHELNGGTGVQEHAFECIEFGYCFNSIGNNLLIGGASSAAMQP